MKRLIAVYGSSNAQPQTSEWDTAFSWGKTIAENGFGVATGGYHGTMEAVSKGCKEAGGFVVGVTSPTLFPDRMGPNRFVDLGRVDMIALSGVLAARGVLGVVARCAAQWANAHFRCSLHSATQSIPFRTKPQKLAHVNTA